MRLLSRLIALLAFAAGSVFPAAAAPSYTGLWWIPAENGWGANTNHQGDTIFATLFTYAPDGAAMWLVGSNLAKQADGSFSGDLHRLRGPAYAASPWNPAAVEPTRVGTMTWRFASETAATLAYSYEGRTVTKSVVRQAFASPVPACVATTGSRAGDTNYQDLWWGGPAESGWGINFTHQGATIFGTLFTYDVTGRDLWLFAAMARQADGTYAGTLSGAEGPPFDSQPWPATFAPTPVGNMTFQPVDGERGILTYVVGCVEVRKSIRRQDFGLADRPSCR